MNAMAHVKDDILSDLLGKIPNPAERQQYADLITGKVQQEIRCLSKVCKGRVIGYVYTDGRVMPVADDEGQMFLRSSRNRLDGFKGFECWCGNDSRRSVQEMNDLPDNGNPPTPEGLERIFDNVKNKPSKYPPSEGRQVIDGFELKVVI